MPFPELPMRAKMDTVPVDHIFIIEQTFPVFSALVITKQECEKPPK